MTKVSTKPPLILLPGLALMVMPFALTGCFVGTFYLDNTEVTPQESSSPTPTPTETPSTVPAPEGILRVSPTAPLGNITTPTLRIAGVQAGDTVKLYSDSTCSTQVASGTASGISIDLTPSTALTEGTYEFRAKTSNSNGTSTCSTAFAVYTLDTTPPTVTVSAPSSSVKALGSGVTFTVTYTDANGMASSNLPNTAITLNPNPGTGGCAQISVTQDSVTSKTVHLDDCLGKAAMDLWVNGGNATDNAGNTSLLKVVNGFLTIGNKLTALPADEPAFSGLPSNDIRALSWDDTDGELWVGSRSGISKLDSAGNVLAHYTTKNGGLTGNHITAIWAGGNKLFAPTSGAGGMISTSNNGVSFSTISGTGLNPFYSLFAVFSPDSGTTVYTAGQMGVSKSTDFGATFSQIDTSYTGSIAASGAYVLAGTANNLGIRFSSDSGASFTTKNVAGGTLPSNSVNAVYIDSSTGPTFYTATDLGLVKSNSDFSSNTTLLPGTKVLDVVARGTDIYAATASGVRYSTNSGASFAVLSAAGGLPSDHINRLALPPAGSSTNKLFVGTDQGLSIQDLPLLPTNTETNVTTVVGLADADTNAIDVIGARLFVGTGVGLAISSDGGATFTNKGAAVGLGGGAITPRVRKVVARTVGGSIYLYVATDYGLYLSTDTGTTFTRLSAAGIGTDAVYDVYADGTNVLAATKTTGLWVSTDDGTLFTQFNGAAEWGTGGFFGNEVLSTTLIGGRIYAGVLPAFGSGYVVSIALAGLGGIWTKDPTFLTPNTLAKIGTSLVVGDNGASGIYMDTNSDGILEGPTNIVSFGAGSNTVYDMHSDGNYVCFATGNGVSLSRLSAPTTAFFSFNNVQGAGSNAVRGCRVSSGRVYIATSGGVSVLK